MVSSNRKPTIAVEPQRLDVESQAWFDWLLDQNNERRLTLAEREELQGLIAQYEHRPLQNTEALCRQPVLTWSVPLAGSIEYVSPMRRVALLASSASPAVPEWHSLGKRNMPPPQFPWWRACQRCCRSHRSPWWRSMRW